GRTVIEVCLFRQAGSQSPSCILGELRGTEVFRKLHFSSKTRLKAAFKRFNWI
ncbi:hypothetical protein AMELA_G00242250, partial [Ameiurus melas]